MFTFHSKKTQNFQQAKNSCITDGYRLAVVDDKLSWDEIRAYENSDLLWSYWWLGAEKQEGQEEFHWLDGNVFTAARNEATISSDEPGNRCLALYARHSTKTLKLFSLPCDRHLYYICEGVKFDLSTEIMNLTTSGEHQEISTVHKDEMYTSTVSNSIQTEPKSTTMTTILQTIKNSGDLIHSLSSDNNVDQTSMTTISQILNNPQRIADDKLFSPSTDSDVDQASWMFVALALALLLVVSIVMIAKLWTENKKLRNRVKATLFLKPRQEDYSVPTQRNNVTVTEGWRNGPTEVIAMTTTESL